MYEFGVLASVWRAHDPEDPQSAGIPPETLAVWNSDAERCNFSVDAQSQYAIDLADLAAFVEGAPWPLAPRLRQVPGSEQMMILGGESMLLTELQALSLEGQAVQEQPALQQLGALVNIIGQLETIWLTDPDIQQEVDAADWQHLLEALYGDLLEAYMSTQ